MNESLNMRFTDYEIKWTIRKNQGESFGAIGIFFFCPGVFMRNAKESVLSPKDVKELEWLRESVS